MVVAGWLGGEIFKVEHVDIPVPRHGGLQGSCHGQSSTGSSSHSRDAADEAFTGFFRTYTKRKKCEDGSALGGRN